MSRFGRRFEAASQRLSTVEEIDSTYAESRIPVEQMSLRTLPPVAEQIVPLIRISGVKEDDMSFMFKRRRGRRRGLFWLSVASCIALFVLGLLLWRPGVGESSIVLQKGELRPLIRESWLGWANSRYIFVLYGPGRESSG